VRATPPPPFLNPSPFPLIYPSSLRYSVKAHKTMMNAMDGCGGANVGYGAPEIATAGRDGSVKICERSFTVLFLRKLRRRHQRAVERNIATVGNRERRGPTAARRARRQPRGAGRIRRQARAPFPPPSVFCNALAGTVGAWRLATRTMTKSVLWWRDTTTAT
jgi:hypothetical protein